LGQRRSRIPVWSGNSKVSRAVKCWCERKLRTKLRTAHSDICPERIWALERIRCVYEHRVLFERRRAEVRRIDDVVEPTLDALLVMESQIHEGGANGYAGLYPEDETGRQRRREEVRRDLARRYAGYADSYRDTLVKFYGEEQGRKIRSAQAFEVCEYGRQPSRDELKQMFPF
jgi:hypothetical protein